MIRKAKSEKLNSFIIAFELDSDAIFFFAIVHLQDTKDY